MDSVKAVIFDLEGLLVRGFTAEPLPGVQNILKVLQQQQIPCAIASNATTTSIQQVVDLQQWKEYFLVLVGIDRVNFRGKPEPDIYLLAAEHLGVDPKYCVVLEDSAPGAWAAKHAGMRCIAVPGPRTRVDDVAHADLVVSSLENKKVLEYLQIVSE